MGVKTNDVFGKKEKIPGPGAYNTNTKDSKIKNEPAFSIGTG